MGGDPVVQGYGVSKGMRRGKKRRGKRMISDGEAPRVSYRSRCHGVGESLMKSER